MALALLRHFDTIAFHALLQSPERTLSEKEEQKFIAKVAEAAKDVDWIGTFINAKLQLGYGFVLFHPN